MVRESLLSGVLAAALASQVAVPRGAATFANGTRVSLEVVADNASRERGLMFRERLGPNEGMIFAFPRTGVYPFWMKNTLIPLDLVWLDGAGRILAIAPSVPPCKADPCPSYSPVTNGRLIDDAIYVIEVVSGFARQHTVKVGDRVTLEGVPAKGR